MALVETGMFVGAVPPWVGQGIDVKEAQSSAEAIKLSGLDWEVLSKNIQVAGGSGIPGYKANVRSTDGKVLGLVTDRYKIVQNRDAFAFTDELLGSGVKYETAGSLSDGKRIWLLAKMDTAKILGEDVEPYMVFTNSHDGKGAVKIAMTPIRVVCQNSLSLALSRAKRTWTTRHAGDISFKLEDARKTLELASKYMNELEAEADEMSQIVIPSPLFMQYLYTMFPMKDDASERQKRNIEMQRDALKSLYESKDDIQRFKGTGYGLMLAATDYASHFKGMRETNTASENRFMDIVDGNSLIENTSKFLSTVR